MGGTCPVPPACLFAAASQDGSCGFIRAEILGAVDMQQLCQPCTRAIDARFDRADCATTDARSFLVGKSRRAHKDQGLALLGRQLRQSLTKFSELHMTGLVQLLLERFCVMPVAVLNLAPALAIFRTEMVAQNGEEPRRHVRARLECVDVRQREQQGFLHQVIRTIHVSTQGNRERAETGHRTENGFADRLVHGHQRPSFFSSPWRRLRSSLNRSGTPWLTTSSYIARSCCPSRACTSRPSFAGFKLAFLLRVAAVSIGFCCPTGLRSFISSTPNFRPLCGVGCPLVCVKTIDCADGSPGTE